MQINPGEQPGLEELAYAGRLHIAPFADISIQIDQALNVQVDGSRSRPFSDESPPVPIQSYHWTARARNPAPLTVLEPTGQTLAGEVQAPRLTLSAPSVDGEYYLSLRVVDAHGRNDSSSTYFVVADGRPCLRDWSWENTAWVDRAVVYGVIPRNFGPHGYNSITERLDDLQGLGVTALWLSPINATPPKNFGYHVLNYLELSDQYGSKEDFRRMVQAAHQRGIRVLMDFVPNHTSDQHRYFQDTLTNGPASPYYNFYDRDETGNHTYYFHWTYLPNLNFNNPQVVNWITEAFVYWVRAFDVDGFRVDVAWGIRERNPEYWPRWRQALMRIKPDLLLLAEAGARDDYYFTEGYDSAYDWTDELGHWAWEHVFEDRALLTERLQAALTQNGKGFHPDALIFRFLNNNDTAERFLTRCGLEMTRVATALLLTLPGLPCLYTGDEIGAEFMPYKNPEPIGWVLDPHNLRPYHQKLIALRKTVPALHSRNWNLLPAEPRQQVFAYLRTAAGREPPVLVVLNFGETPAEASLPLPAGFDDFKNRDSLFDLLTERSIAVSGQNPLTVHLPPMSAYLLSLPSI